MVSGELKSGKEGEHWRKESGKNKLFPLALVGKNLIFSFRASKKTQPNNFLSFLNFFKKIYLLMESEINARFKSSLAEEKPFGDINCGGGAVALSTSKSLGWAALGLCQLWQQRCEQGPGPQEGCVALALRVSCRLTLSGGVAELQATCGALTLRLWLDTGGDKALKYSRTVLSVKKSIWIIRLACFTLLFYSLHCNTSILNLFSHKKNVA